MNAAARLAPLKFVLPIRIWYWLHVSAGPLGVVNCGPTLGHTWNIEVTQLLTAAGSLMVCAVAPDAGLKFALQLVQLGAGEPSVALLLFPLASRTVVPAPSVKRYSACSPAGTGLAAKAREVKLLASTVETRMERNHIRVQMPSA